MTSNKPLISGNWKMHLTHLEAIRLVQELSFMLAKADFADVEVSVHPPFSALRSVQVVLDDAKMPPLELGAQNCYFEESGAFTGEISAQMLKALQVKYVILGHSERRQHFGETDEAIAKKLAAVWEHKMIPILAVGETLEEREMGTTEQKIQAQLEASLADAKPSAVGDMVIAYEPLWAIGSGRPATPDDAEQIADLIRKWIKSNKNNAAAKSVRIQYGGSVKPINVGDFMSTPGIDGVLVGGASLNARDFARMIVGDLDI